MWQYYKSMLLPGAKDRYQLLCANCNWIKRYEENEDRRGRLQIEMATHV